MRNSMKRKLLAVIALGAGLTPWPAMANAYMNSQTTNTVAADVVPRTTPEAVVSENGRVECRSSSGACDTVSTIDMANNTYYNSDRNYYYRSGDDRNTGYSMRAER